MNNAASWLAYCIARTEQRRVEGLLVRCLRAEDECAQLRALLIRAGAPVREPWGLWGLPVEYRTAHYEYILRLREKDGLLFRQVGAKIGLSASGARDRYLDARKWREQQAAARPS